MGVRTISDPHIDKSALYDSVTDRAFGPIFHGVDDAEEFLAWYNAQAFATDPRVLSPVVLESRVAAWQVARAIQSGGTVETPECDEHPYQSESDCAKCIAAADANLTQPEIPF